MERHDFLSSIRRHVCLGPQGIEFDRLELLDLDGDLDVLACEESEVRDLRRQGLGVIWYENPAGDQRDRAVFRERRNDSSVAQSPVP